jgi:hypothetical protein
MEKKIYISCNTLINTEKSLEHLYKKIYNSKLKDCKIILVHDSKFNLENLNIYNLNIQYVLSLDNGYEYPALHKLWEDSQTHQFYGLYLHCKGSSKEDINLFNLDLIWMNCMLYGLLDHADLCIEYLKKEVDLVGCMWYRHFKGNFFWFKSDYIKHMLNPLNMLKLKTPKGESWYSRFDAEYWCCYSYWYGGNIIPLPFPKVKNLFYLEKDLLEYNNENILPDLNKEHVCDNITYQIQNNLYEIFNTIILKKKEYELYSDILFKYMDYNCEIIIKD